MPHSPELHGKICAVVARSDDWKDYSVVCKDTKKKHFVEEEDLEMTAIVNSNSMDDIKVWDIWTYNNPDSKMNNWRCTIESVQSDGRYFNVRFDDWYPYTVYKDNFTKLPKQPMTKTAQAIQERIVKKYLTNKKLDELTEIIEEVRDGIKDNKDTIDFCKKELEVLEDLDYCLNKAIDEGNIEDIKSMENKYKEFLNGN